jgi:hypothetical protein
VKVQHEKAKVENVQISSLKTKIAWNCME